MGGGQHQKVNAHVLLQEYMKLQLLTVAHILVLQNACLPAPFLIQSF